MFNLEVQDGGSLSLINSTISNNSATGRRSQAGSGGGIRVSYGESASLINSTISGNSASGGSQYSEPRGGGVLNGGTLTLTRTVISRNSAADGAEVNNAGDSSVTAASFNLFGYRGLTNDEAFENFTPGPTDITATSNGNDPTTLANILNTILANNGGPTRTHALVAGSPAIDTVTDGTCPPPLRDQRGVRRPQDGNNDGAAICDTGSFERR